MKAQVANNMMSSFLAFLDNRILDRGEAFTNHSSQLYELSQGVHGNYTIWGAPFKQMVCDAHFANHTKNNHLLFQSSRGVLSTHQDNPHIGIHI